MKKGFHLAYVALFMLMFYACSSDNEASKINEAVSNTAADLLKAEESKKATPAATVDTKPAYGIDISKFQGDEIDLLDQQQDSLSFVICKATEGITYTDPSFKNNWKTIPEKGFIRGAYHFYRTVDDPKKQAANFLNAIKDIQANDIPPIVDFEGAGIDPSQSIGTIQDGLKIFLNTIEEKLNRKPMIYTDIPTGNKYLDNPIFGDYALWIALYEDLEQPKLPLAWNDKQWSFWQKESDYAIGKQKNDFDVFNGDLDDLTSFIQTY